MNSVQLIGRLTRDPQITYTEAGLTIARFSIAIDRGKDKDGNDRGADFPGIVCFGKAAELVDKYVHKGRLVGVSGRIQTGKYDKDGTTVYTTDIVADRVEFLDRGKSGAEDASTEEAPTDGFSKLTDEDIPF